jgi:glycosyltransferase involved in cell wall biosynthesis
VDDLAQPEALRYLAAHADALVVVPSLVDNSPYAVIECLELRLNLIASRVGGIPELVQTPECLFEPTVADLGDKLLECFQQGIPAVRPGYSAEAARAAWREVHEMPPPPPRGQPASPAVSVCVAHFNHGDFLPQALESLQRQTYAHFEVIVVDDGSTDPASREMFRALQRQYAAAASWKFFEKEHGHLGHTRNFAARRAAGELLVFMDSDNIAVPGMIERMVRGMDAARADCLTCHHLTFQTDALRLRGQFKSRVDPLGACLELAIYENILGDANFIVRREAFEKLGGFSEDRDLAYEDWEFLLKLVVNGFVMDVIPEALFHYRKQPSSMVRTTDHYLSHQRALRPVLEKLDPWQRRFVQNAVGSYWTMRNDLPHLERLRRKRRKSVLPKLGKIWLRFAPRRRDQRPLARQSG